MGTVNEIDHVLIRMEKIKHPDDMKKQVITKDKVGQRHKRECC